MTDDDFKRLESKVDKLSDAIQRLILIEERQSSQGERIGKVEQRVANVEGQHNKLDTKVERWINRGIGVWGLAVTLFALLQCGASRRPAGQRHRLPQGREQAELSLLRVATQFKPCRHGLGECGGCGFNVQRQPPAPEVVLGRCGGRW